MKSSSLNPYDPPQSSSNSAANWKTWSPFQPEEVRDICAHMTAEETSTITRRGYLYGLWVAVSLILPIQAMSVGFVTGKINPILFATAALLVTTHIICIPIWQRRQRQFLCGTKWAREKDIQPESLKLFGFRTLRKA